MTEMTKLRSFTMPKWGIEMTEGVVAEWLVKQGEPFKKGQLLALIETDKITNEVEAEFDAQFVRFVAATGETLAVGALLGVLADPQDQVADADVDAFIAQFKAADTSTAADKGHRPSPEATAKPAPAAAAAASIPDSIDISPAAKAFALAQGVDVSAIQGSGRDGRITFQDVHQAAQPEAPAPRQGPVDITPTGTQLDPFYASPLAKRLAARHGVDLSQIKGTGPRGRISKADVLAKAPASAAPAQGVAAATWAAASGPSFARPAPGTSTVVKMSPMRKAIARQLSHSKSTIPHYYLRSRVRLDSILAMRERAKAATGEAPSVNDYLIRACALALRDHPDVNIQVHDDEIRHFADADIAVAVATDKGLITPIIRAADRKTVAEIGREARALAARARDGKLKPEEFQGGSFSVSNLGMFGIDQFDAIINPPQGAILAIGAGVRTPVEHQHALSFATIAALSLSCDHRAIDGAVGAQFMATLKAYIEEPEKLTAG